MLTTQQTARKVGSNSAKPSRKIAKTSKADKIINLLKRKRGASIIELAEATGWHAHSVRGFLSGTVKKKLGHALISKPDNKGLRRYQIIEA